MYTSEDENNDYSQQEEAPRQNEISRNQKIAAGVLAFFGVLVIIMWFVQLKNSINAPFKRSSGNSTITATNTESTALSDEELKTQDTDGDGLSDWDELNVYNTSPYLPDSDGDGISDYEEIKANTDPNCPVGQTCVNTETNFATSSAGVNFSLGSAGNSTSSSSGNSAVDQAAQAVLSGQIDAATLRALLIQSGVDEAELNKISDQDLMKAYQDNLSSQ